eukprot:gene7055-1261_t
MCFQGYSALTSTFAPHLRVKSRAACACTWQATHTSVACLFRHQSHSWGRAPTHITLGRSNRVAIRVSWPPDLVPTAPAAQLSPLVPCTVKTSYLFLRPMHPCPAPSPSYLNTHPHRPAGPTVRIAPPTWALCSLPVARCPALPQPPCAQVESLGRHLRDRSPPKVCTRCPPEAPALTATPPGLRALRSTGRPQQPARDPTAPVIANTNMFLIDAYSHCASQPDSGYCPANCPASPSIAPCPPDMCTFLTPFVVSVMPPAWITTGIFLLLADAVCATGLPVLCQRQH